MTLTELFSKGAVTWNQVRNIERFAKVMLEGYQGDPQYNRALCVNDRFGISCQDFMVSVKAWHLLELSQRFNIGYPEMMSTYSKHYDYDISSYLIGTPSYFSSIGTFEWARNLKEISALDVGIPAFNRLLVNLHGRTVTTEHLVTVSGTFSEDFWSLLFSTLRFQLTELGKLDFQTAFKEAIPKSLDAAPGTTYFTAVTGLRRITLFSEKQNTCLFLKLMIDKNISEFEEDVRLCFNA